MVIHILSHKAEPYFTHRRHFAQRWESNDFVLKERYYTFLETNPRCNPPDKYGGNRAALTCYYDHWLRTRLTEPFNCTFFYLTRGVDGLETCDPDLVVRNYQHMDAKAGDFKCLAPCTRSDRRVLHSTQKYRDRTVFGVLRIFFSDLEYKWFEERLATNVPDFISELGGQSSLFVGASLITFVKLLFGLEHSLRGRSWLRCRHSR